MPSSHAAIATTSSPVAVPAPPLSTTPPASSALSDPRFASLSPKSIAPEAGIEATAPPGGKNYYSAAPLSSRFATHIPYTPAQHVASAASRPLQAFRAASLPRTSSLLPPPRTAAESAQPTSHNRPDDQPPGPYNVPGSLEPGLASSRTTSVGGASDSFCNLNRWSASTASSRASRISHRKSSSLHRPTSGDIIAGVSGSPSRAPEDQQPLPDGPAQPASPGSARQGSATLGPPPLLALPSISTAPFLITGFESGSVARDSDTGPEAHARQPGSDEGYHQGNGPGTTVGIAPVAPSQIGRTRAGGSAESTCGPMDAGKGHSRSRSASAKGSNDSSSQPRNRDRLGKRPSQKAMLAKALQKANMAVQLDNAQNLEGARAAYAAACDLLQQVLDRTGGEEDRRKLEAIHTTYSSRIEELDELVPDLTRGGKALPERPESSLLQDSGSSTASAVDVEEEVVIETAVAARVVQEKHEGAKARTLRSSSLPAPTSVPHPNPRSPYLGADTTPDSPPSAFFSQQYSMQTSLSELGHSLDRGSALRTADGSYMPPPLSPRKPLPPAKTQERDVHDFAFGPEVSSASFLAPMMNPLEHRRGNSHESISWLDPIDESAGSSASSVHSRSSSLGVRRRHIRAASGNTEAEFDAALDDAIEAAYNDGYEPDSVIGSAKSGFDAQGHEKQAEDAVAKALRRVELARERVRETEREAMELANERERRLRQELEEEELRQRQQLGEDEPRQRQRQHPSSSVKDFFDGNDSDEEERLLEEVTGGYRAEDMGLGRQPRPIIPRDSDLSWSTHRTLHSFTGSNAQSSSAGTMSLSTVNEGKALPDLPQAPSQLPPPPPEHPLPQLPMLPPPANPPNPTGSNGQGVRSRRLSGQNPKQLKIETSKLPQPGPAAPTVATAARHKVSGQALQQKQAPPSGAIKAAESSLAKPAPSPALIAAEPSGALPTPPPAIGSDGEPRSGSPSVPRPGLRKNFSSSSLKSLRVRNPSVSHMDELPDFSPITPLGSQFGIGASMARLPAMPSLPPALSGAFKDRSNSTSAGGLRLLESDFHSPRSPGSPNPLLADAPLPLEPCPSDAMLRPFWLMRCLYQTLCHPRGGYLSSKLFVPRDAWRIKGVKLKNVEDKISNCDLLTAALQKLARVDNCDADAVLEEMQTLEGLLEQVQGTLARRLGNDVGVHGTSNLFKEATGVETEAAPPVPRSASISGKSSSFSWRRLRSKNSSAGLGSTYSGRSGSGGFGSSVTTLVDGAGSKESPLPSLPMTGHPTNKPAKRDIEGVEFTGPNSQYMASLARLFDAAQTIDLIARQVDDPGLRHADKTQVGLELCTRHAAEFFGFYICRFALADLMILLDKFIKKGTEWVLS